MKRALAVSGSHPYGVQPSGNAYFKKSRTVGVKESGLGSLGCVDDALVIEILGLLDGSSLLQLGSVSKSFYVFSHLDELYRFIVLCDFEGNFEFQGTWRETLRLLMGGPTIPTHVPLEIPGFFSDQVYQRWLCCQTQWPKEWLSVDNVPRIDGSKTSREEFIAKYEKPNKPVVVTGLVDQWPVFKQWSTDNLIKNAGDELFSVQSVDMNMKNYLRYAQSTNEESPLYMFEENFATKGLSADYEVPEYFSEDFFQVLGDNRPNYRWIIIGPKQSGSSFHKDPNSTSAWNALLQGSKKWIFYPPHITPPGVAVSSDESTVATPSSLAEWFMNHYEEDDPDRLECVVEPGTLVFVPRGWWHLVVNLDFSIAITQNFVNSSNLPSVLRFLDQKRDQVSGYGNRCESLYEDFSAAMHAEYPQLMKELEAKKKPHSMVSSLFGGAYSTGFSFGR